MYKHRQPGMVLADPGALIDRVVGNERTSRGWGVGAGDVSRRTMSCICTVVGTGTARVVVWRRFSLVMGVSQSGGGSRGTVSADRRHGSVWCACELGGEGGKREAGRRWGR